MKSPSAGSTTNTKLHKAIKALEYKWTWVLKGTLMPNVDTNIKGLLSPLWDNKCPEGGISRGPRKSINKELNSFEQVLAVIEPRLACK